MHTFAQALEMRETEFSGQNKPYQFKKARTFKVLAQLLQIIS